MYKDLQNNYSEYLKIITKIARDNPEYLKYLPTIQGGAEAGGGGVGDSVSIGEIEGATLVTESEGIAANDNDVTIPTCAAAKDLLDLKKLDTLAAPTDITTRDATTILHGLFPKLDKVKLDAIAALAEVNPALISQAEAEAGSATTERIFSALRVKQAIDALAGGGGQLELVEDFTQSGTGTTKTFTFTADDFSTVAEYVLYIMGSFSAGTPELQVEINGITDTNYQTDGRAISGGSETITDINNGTFGTLFTNVQQVIGSLHFGRIESFDTVQLLYELGGDSGDGSSSGSIWLTTSITTLSSIRIFVNTSTWTTGMRMILYKVKST